MRNDSECWISTRWRAGCFGLTSSWCGIYSAVGVHLELLTYSSLPSMLLPGGTVLRSRSDAADSTYAGGSFLTGWWRPGTRCWRMLSLHLVLTHSNPSSTENLQIGCTASIDVSSVSLQAGHKLQPVLSCVLSLLNNLPRLADPLRASFPVHPLPVPLFEPCTAAREEAHKVSTTAGEHNVYYAP